MKNNEDEITRLLEQQRYDAIKATGEWVELNILIGTETIKDSNERDCRIPVIRFEGHECGPKEIACMYLSIKSMLDELKQEYPEECLAAELSAYVEKEPLS